MMDSNNFTSNVGMGEREGRVFSAIVSRRHYGLSHGIGRSGDIAEVQPKAAGSSLLYKLTTKLVVHALEIAGLKNVKNCLLVPMATGMTLTMCMLSLRKANPLAKYVIWSRIDQKSCFKSIMTAGYIPLIVDQVINERGEMQTNVSEIQSLIERHNSEILCVLSTTSCFAPRQPDLIDQIARCCQAANVPHIINNAYGIQCGVICKLINRAAAVGRVDAVVQSTDKNFLVPVGGAIIFSPQPAFIAAMSSLYPGRASASPIVDIFVTLLAMGESGFQALLQERSRLLPVLRAGVHDYVTTHHGSVTPAPGNCISFALTIPALATQPAHCSLLGSMLFKRNVSGSRVVAITDKVTVINGHEFRNWGSHTSVAQSSYITVACSIGLTEEEISCFLERMNATTALFMRRAEGKQFIPSAAADVLLENLPAHDFSDQLVEENTSEIEENESS